MPIDKKFWDGKRWQSHAAFRTINHIHIACYAPAEGGDTCDIMIVECEDGRWYIEDYWGDDAKGASGVWSPFDPSDVEPFFFESKETALRHAVSVVEVITGHRKDELLNDYLED